MQILSTITITPEERRRRRIWYSLIAVFLSALFMTGFFTVYVNSYNIMHKEPMEVFGVYESSEGFSVVVFNHKFNLDFINEIFK